MLPPRLLTKAIRPPSRPRSERLRHSTCRWRAPRRRRRWGMLDSWSLHGIPNRLDARTDSTWANQHLQDRNRVAEAVADRDSAFRDLWINELRHTRASARPKVRHLCHTGSEGLDERHALSIGAGLKTRQSNRRLASFFTGDTRPSHPWHTRRLASFQLGESIWIESCGTKKRRQSHHAPAHRRTHRRRWRRRVGLARSRPIWSAAARPRGTRARGPSRSAPVLPGE